MGINDTVSSTLYLQFDFGFNDGDSRKQNVPNPRFNITSNEVATLDSWMRQSNIVIGDKYGASSTGINSAVLVATERRKLDLT